MRETVIGGALGELVKAYGGVDAFAKRLGVAPVTVWRWGIGRTTPLREYQRLMGQMAKRKRLREPF